MMEIDENGEIREIEPSDIDRQDKLIAEHNVKLPDGFIAEYANYKQGLTSWQKIKLYTKVTIAIIKILFILKKGEKMGTSWKTTVTAIIGALAVIINTVFSLKIPTEAIITVVLFLIGLFAKDHDKQ